MFLLFNGMQATSFLTLEKLAHGRHRTAFLSEEANVRPLSDVLAVRVPENALNVSALVAHDAGNLWSSVVDNSAADFHGLAVPEAAVRAGLGATMDNDNAHNFVLGKVASHVDNADGE